MDFAIGFLTNNIHTDCCDSVPSVLTWIHFHYTQSCHYLRNQNPKVVNTNSKLKFNTSVAMESLCFKCGETLKLRNLKLRKTLHYLCGVLARTTKN